MRRGLVLGLEYWAKHNLRRKNIFSKKLISATRFSFKTGSSTKTKLRRLNPGKLIYLLSLGFCVN